MRAWSSTSPLRILSLAISVVLLSLFVVPQAVLAEGKTIGSKDLEVTKEQLARMRQLFSSVDAKMQAAVKGDEALTKAMQKELKEIGAIKDSAEKRKAIAAYQSKYAKQYERILKKSGVDLTSLASQLNSIFPYLQFLAQPNFTLIARLRQALAEPNDAVSGPKVTTTTIRSYTNHKSLGCGAIGGSDITIGNDEITNSTFAAEVGGCSNHGDKTAAITVPGGAISAHADGEADLSVEAFAFGALGIATSSASASLEIKLGLGSSIGTSVSVSTVAPFLWAGSAEESINGRVGRDLELDRPYQVIAFTSTSSLAAGVVAGTNATATLSDLEASLTVEQ